MRSESTRFFMAHEILYFLAQGTEEFLDVEAKVVIHVGLELLFDVVGDPSVWLLLEFLSHQTESLPKAPGQLQLDLNGVRL